MKIIKFLRHLLHEMVVYLVPNFLKKNVLRCSEVHKILASEPDLSFSGSLKLKFHILICQCCTDYSKQLKLIKNESKALGKVELTPEQKARVSKSRDQILEKLKSS
tara:strand:+ start:66 stop:383 length:318 start_codon:yes stop_codon:yes gene_type:complete